MGDKSEGTDNHDLNIQLLASYSMKGKHSLLFRASFYDDALICLSINGASVSKKTQIHNAVNKAVEKGMICTFTKLRICSIACTKENLNENELMEKGKANDDGHEVRDDRENGDKNPHKVDLDRDHSSRRVSNTIFVRIKYLYIDDLTLLESVPPAGELLTGLPVTSPASANAGSSLPIDGKENAWNDVLKQNEGDKKNEANSARREEIERERRNNVVREGNAEFPEGDQSQTPSTPSERRRGSTAQGGSGGGGGDDGDDDKVKDRSRKGRSDGKDLLPDKDSEDESEPSKDTKESPQLPTPPGSMPDSKADSSVEDEVCKTPSPNVSHDAQNPTPQVETEKVKSKELEKRDEVEREDLHMPSLGSGYEGETIADLAQNISKSPVSKAPVTHDDREIANSAEPMATSTNTDSEKEAVEKNAATTENPQNVNANSSSQSSSDGKQSQSSPGQSQTPSTPSERRRGSTAQGGSGGGGGDGGDDNKDKDRSRKGRSDGKDLLPDEDSEDESEPSKDTKESPQLSTPPGSMPDSKADNSVEDEVCKTPSPNVSHDAQNPTPQVETEKVKSKELEKRDEVEREDLHMPSLSLGSGYEGETIADLAQNISKSPVSKAPVTHDDREIANSAEPMATSTNTDSEKEAVEKNAATTENPQNLNANSSSQSSSDGKQSQSSPGQSQTPSTPSERRRGSTAQGGSGGGGGDDGDDDKDKDRSRKGRSDGKDLLPDEDSEDENEPSKDTKESPQLPTPPGSLPDSKADSSVEDEVCKTPSPNISHDAQNPTPQVETEKVKSKELEKRDEVEREDLHMPSLGSGYEGETIADLAQNISKSPVSKAPVTHDDREIANSAEPMATSTNTDSEKEAVEKNAATTENPQNVNANSSSQSSNDGKQSQSSPGQSQTPSTPSERRRGSTAQGGSGGGGGDDGDDDKDKDRSRKGRSDGKDLLPDKDSEDESEPSKDTKESPQLSTPPGSMPDSKADSSVEDEVCKTPSPNVSHDAQNPTPQVETEKVKSKELEKRDEVEREDLHMPSLSLGSGYEGETIADLAQNISKSPVSKVPVTHDDREIANSAEPMATSTNTDSEKEAVEKNAATTENPQNVNANSSSQSSSDGKQSQSSPGQSQTPSTPSERRRGSTAQGGSGGGGGDDGDDDKDKDRSRKGRSDGKDLLPDEDSEDESEPSKDTKESPQLSTPPGSMPDSKADSSVEDEVCKTPSPNVSHDAQNPTPQVETEKVKSKELEKRDEVEREDLHMPSLGSGYEGETIADLAQNISKSPVSKAPVTHDDREIANSAEPMATSTNTDSEKEAVEKNAAITENPQNVNANSSSQSSSDGKQSQSSPGQSQTPSTPSERRRGSTAQGGSGGGGGDDGDDDKDKDRSRKGRSDGKDLLPDEDSEDESEPSKDTKESPQLPTPPGSMPDSKADSSVEDEVCKTPSPNVSHDAQNPTPQVETEKVKSKELEKRDEVEREDLHMPSLGSGYEGETIADLAQNISKSPVSKAPVTHDDREIANSAEPMATSTNTDSEKEAVEKNAATTENPQNVNANSSSQSSSDGKQSQSSPGQSQTPSTPSERRRGSTAQGGSGGGGGDDGDDDKDKDRSRKGRSDGKDLLPDEDSEDESEPSKDTKESPQLPTPPGSLPDSKADSSVEDEVCKTPSPNISHDAQNPTPQVETEKVKSKELEKRDEVEREDLHMPSLGSGYEGETIADLAQNISKSPVSKAPVTHDDREIANSAEPMATSTNTDSEKEAVEKNAATTENPQNADANSSSQSSSDGKQSQSDPGGNIISNGGNRGNGDDKDGSGKGKREGEVPEKRKDEFEGEKELITTQQEEEGPKLLIPPGSLDSASISDSEYRVSKTPTLSPSSKPIDRRVKTLRHSTSSVPLPRWIGCRQRKRKCNKANRRHTRIHSHTKAQPKCPRNDSNRPNVTESQRSQNCNQSRSKPKKKSNYCSSTNPEASNTTMPSSQNPEQQCQEETNAAHSTLVTTNLPGSHSGSASKTTSLSQQSRQNSSGHTSVQFPRPEIPVSLVEDSSARKRVRKKKCMKSFPPCIRTVEVTEQKYSRKNVLPFRKKSLSRHQQLRESSHRTADRTAERKKGQGLGLCSSKKPDNSNREDFPTVVADISDETSTKNGQCKRGQHRKMQKGRSVRKRDVMKHSGRHLRRKMRKKKHRKSWLLRTDGQSESTAGDDFPTRRRSRSQHCHPVENSHRKVNKKKLGKFSLSEGQGKFGMTYGSCTCTCMCNSITTSPKSSQSGQCQRCDHRKGRVRKKNGVHVHVHVSRCGRSHSVMTSPQSGQCQRCQHRKGHMRMKNVVRVSRRGRSSWSISLPDGAPQLPWVAKRRRYKRKKKKKNKKPLNADRPPPTAGDAQHNGCTQDSAGYSAVEIRIVSDNLTGGSSEGRDSERSDLWRQTKERSGIEEECVNGIVSPSLETLVARDTEYEALVRGDKKIGSSEDTQPPSKGTKPFQGQNGEKRPEDIVAPEDVPGISEEAYGDHFTAESGYTSNQSRPTAPNTAEKPVKTQTPTSSGHLATITETSTPAAEKPCDKNPSPVHTTKVTIEQLVDLEQSRNLLTTAEPLAECVTGDNLTVLLVHASTNIPYDPIHPVCEEITPPNNEHSEPLIACVTTPAPDNQQAELIAGLGSICTAVSSSQASLSDTAPSFPPSISCSQTSLTDAAALNSVAIECEIPQNNSSALVVELRPMPQILKEMFVLPRSKFHQSTDPTTVNSPRPLSVRVPRDQSYPTLVDCEQPSELCSYDDESEEDSTGEEEDVPFVPLSQLAHMPVEFTEQAQLEEAELTGLDESHWVPPKEEVDP